MKKILSTIYFTILAIGFHFIASLGTIPEPYNYVPAGLILVAFSYLFFSDSPETETQLKHEIRMLKKENDVLSGKMALLRRNAVYERLKRTELEKKLENFNEERKLAIRENRLEAYRDGFYEGVEQVVSEVRRTMQTN